MEIIFKSCGSMMCAKITEDGYYPEFEGNQDEPAYPAYVEFETLHVLGSENQPVQELVCVWEWLDPKYQTRIESDCIAAIKAVRDDN